MQSTPYKIQPKIGKNLLLAILLTFSGGKWCCTSIKTAWTSQLETKNSQLELVSNITYFALADTNQQPSHLSIKFLGTPSNIEPANIQQQSDIVQLEFPTDRVARLSSQSREALLNPQSPHSMDDNEETQIQIFQQQG